MSCKQCHCSDDEAYKYSECFCLCHTRAYQRAEPRYHDVVRHEDGTQFVPTNSGYIQVDP